MAWRTWQVRAVRTACGEVVGREEDVSSVEEGRLLGRREVGSLAMVYGVWPGPGIEDSLLCS